MKMKLILRAALAALMIAAATLGSESAYGQAGTLDPTFGDNGTTITSFGTTGVGIVDALELQGANFLVLVVSGVSEVVRYTSSGALDTTFGDDGIASLLNGSAVSMMLQPNGQIVLAGVLSSSSGAFLAVQRLNANGTQDTSFGKAGLALASLGGRGLGVGEVVLVQPNGDILVGAQLEPTGRRQPFQVMLARFSSTGALDTTFGSGGISVATGSGGCTALALLANGDYLVVSAQAAAEFSPSGSALSTITPSTLVASNGSNEPNSSGSAFQPNGDYLENTELFVGEESRAHNSSVQVFRFTETGAADTTFADPSFHYIGVGGADIQAIPQAVAVAPNGDIVVAGDQVMFARSGDTILNGLARLTPSGELDTTFGSGGTVANNDPPSVSGFIAVVVQPDGNFVAAGITSNSELFLSRYLGQ